MAPVLLLVYNRPKTTRCVFEAIRDARPPELMVVGDGPKDDAEDRQRVFEVRQICESVDWDCRTTFLWRDSNLGLRSSVSDGISRFFSSHEFGIVLEDDCLPSPSFFRFCDELLLRFADDERFMLISGFNTEGQWTEHPYDYFYSHLGGIWGWASWRRAWEHFDVDMALFDSWIESQASSSLFDESLAKYRDCQFRDAYTKSVDTWAYQWGFARNINNGLSIVPRVSLIQNIGFGDDASHTNSRTDKRAKVRAGLLDFPLKHNPVMVPDRRYDNRFFGRISDDEKKTGRSLRLLARRLLARAKP